MSREQKSHQLLIEAIVKEMQHVVGDVAVVQANAVPALAMTKKRIVPKSQQAIITELVERYKRLIGPVAITIAKRAAQKAAQKHKGLKIPGVLK